MGRKEIRGGGEEKEEEGEKRKRQKEDERTIERRGRLRRADNLYGSIGLLAWTRRA